MFINSPRTDAVDFPPIAHGGDLVEARRLFPDVTEPFIDLSTGINPRPYPLPPLPPECFSRLPDRADVMTLVEAAARAYGAPSELCVVPAPGTQILLPMVASLVAQGRAAVLGPTYAEHKRAAALAGHYTIEVSSPEELRQADLAIAVNPNNPDGRILPRELLLSIADDLRRRGGLLVIDEAFADTNEDVSLAGMTNRPNVVVLRSFGKFYGLAGLRLGFALLHADGARQLQALLGPWPISGISIVAGRTAFTDDEWKNKTLCWLMKAVRRLDLLLAAAGLSIIGGTPLFRLTQCANAASLFEHLGRAGILVRRFAENSEWLRWGIPDGEISFQRVERAIKQWGK